MLPSRKPSRQSLEICLRRVLPLHRLRTRLDLRQKRSRRRISRRDRVPPNSPATNQSLNPSRLSSKPIADSRSPYRRDSPLSDSYEQAYRSRMPTPTCPACLSPRARKLEGAFRHASVCYYKCNSCGHVWETRGTGDARLVWCHPKPDRRSRRVPIDFLDRRNH
jgi:hypothetical protein